MSSGWTCSHQQEDTCILLKKKCEPGMKGCTLYGKALFSQSPAEQKRHSDEKEAQSSEEVLESAKEQARFF